MKWTNQQAGALKAVSQWLNGSLQTDHPQIFRLFGFAGTGKTTLTKHLAQDAGNVMFAAYTGKAAHVLNSKGCPASTIHSLIYNPKSKSEARLKDLQIQLADARKEEPPNPSLEQELEHQIALETDQLNRPSFSLNLDTDLNRADLLVIDEWDSVMVFDESSVFRQQWRNWLYTAITRAATRLTVKV
jgi:exodeoxyribonuclease-5